MNSSSHHEPPSSNDQQTQNNQLPSSQQQSPTSTHNTEATSPAPSSVISGSSPSPSPVASEPLVPLISSPPPPPALDTQPLSPAQHEQHNQTHAPPPLVVSTPTSSDPLTTPSKFSTRLPPLSQQPSALPAESPQSSFSNSQLPGAVPSPFPSPAPPQPVQSESVAVAPSVAPPAPAPVVQPAHSQPQPQPQPQPHPRLVEREVATPPRSHPHPSTLVTSSTPVAVAPSSIPSIMPSSPDHASAASPAENPLHRLKRMNSQAVIQATQLQVQQEAMKPSVEKAVRYRDLTCPRIRDNANQYRLYSIWKFSDNDFLKYGLGVMLYFRTVRRLIYIFLYMFFCSLPCLIFNLHGPDKVWIGEKSIDGSYGLAKTTLANQGMQLNTTIFGFNKKEIGLGLGALDCFSTLLYIGFFWWMFSSHSTASTTYNATVLTVRRFTVFVTNLPKVKTVNRLSVAQFFEKNFGEVVDVSMCYNDMHIIQLYKQRGEYKKELSAIELNAVTHHSAASLNKKIADIDRNIAFQRTILDKRAMAAFVTFQRQESVLKCVSTYQDSWWQRYVMPHHLRFFGSPVRVVRAPEPSNVLFANLAIKPSDKRVRRCWTAFIAIAFMSLSFAAVFVSQYYQSRLPTTSACANNSVTSQSEVRTDTDRTCYCARLSASDLIDQSSFCSSYIASYTLSKSLIFVTAFSVVIVNALLQLFMDKLAKLERHASITSQQKKVASRLFIGLFFNTAIIILIVNADIAPYLGKIGVQLVFDGRFSDFVPDWYYEVGVSILITMFLNTMNPHLLSLLAIPYDALKRRWKKPKTQSEMNELYSGRRFVLYERYAVMYNTIFVCMLFGSGMPLLYLVAAITFTLTYWFDKTTFLRSYKIPPRYDESLDELSAFIIPKSAVLHLIMALWVWSSPVTDSFPLGDSIPIVNSAMGQVRSTTSIQARLFQWNTFPCLVLLILIVGWWLVKKVLAVIFFCRANEAVRKNKAVGKKLKQNSQLLTYQAAAARVGLESYRLSRHIDFRSAYLITESRKQLPADVDLHHAREFEKQAAANQPPVAMAKAHVGNKVAPAPTTAMSPAAQKYQVASTHHATAPSVDEAAASDGGSAPTAWSGTAPLTAPGGVDPGRFIPPGAPVSTSISAEETRKLEAARSAANSSLSPSDLGYTTMSVPCQCGHLINIIDCGVQANYTCPVCAHVNQI